MSFRKSAGIAGKYFRDVHICTEGVRLSDLHGLTLSTSKGLGILNEIDPSLVAWLDLDSELWRLNHDNRFNVYRAVCESYWRGRTHDSNRKLLIQTRRKGLMLAEFISRGWEKFIPDELRMRKEFMLPPYGYIVEVETSVKRLRDDIIDSLMDAGIFVMDPGDDSQPLYVSCESLEAVSKILEPEKFLRNTKTQYINHNYHKENSKRVINRRGVFSPDNFACADLVRPCSVQSVGSVDSFAVLHGRSCSGTLHWLCVLEFLRGVRSS